VAPAAADDDDDDAHALPCRRLHLLRRRHLEAGHGELAVAEESSIISNKSNTRAQKLKIEKKKGGRGEIDISEYMKRKETRPGIFKQREERFGKRD